MRKSNIVKGTLILTTAGIVTRLLGFVYRIYMSNIMGAEGMGLYQLIMPIYSLAWSISCSGFSTTVSKLTAQERAKREYGNMGRILKQSVAVTTAVGVALSILLFLMADYFGLYIFKDPRTITSLRILSLAFPFMAAGSCIRGYFLGLQETMVPAVNQVFEQTIRMVVIYFLAGSFIPRGLEYACMVAVIGSVAEEAFSLAFVLFAYYRFKNKNKLNSRPNLSSASSLLLILSMALPLTGNRVVGSLLSTVENILIPERLQLFGMSQSEAISIFGQISGMAMPLIFFPTALLTSLSVSLVPAVSEASALKQYKRITRTISRSVLFASITGMGAAALFTAFSKELGLLLYNQNISNMLFILGLMCPFMYIQVVLAGALNGLGYQVFIFQINLISSAINIAAIYFLVPTNGINAFMLGWFVSLIVVLMMEIGKLRSSIELELDFSNWFLKPALSATAAGLVARYIFGRLAYVDWIHLSPKLYKSIQLSVGVLVLGLLYFCMILLTGCLKISDFQILFSRKKKA